ncbi:MAG: UvrD-helicase domain-containing protein [Alistipes sp.]|nr:UvrD-helicase domain-containing protein [Alistipes sp.]
MRARVLSASAGSGKTFRLAYKFVLDTIKHYKDKPYLYRAILAVTFTNKATEEMKGRILEKLSDITKQPDTSDYMRMLKKDLGLPEEEIIRRADAIMKHILHDYSHFNVMTIDKFFLYIMRSFLKELGMDLNPTIEIDKSLLLQRSVDALIEDTRSDEELQQWITDYVFEKVDEKGEWKINEDLKNIGKDFFKLSDRTLIKGASDRKRLLKFVKTYNASLKNLEAKMKALGQEGVMLIGNAGASVEEFHQKSSGLAGYIIKAASGKYAAPGKKTEESLNGGPFANTPRAAQIAPQLLDIGHKIVEIYKEYSKIEPMATTIRKKYRAFALMQDIYTRMRNCQREDGSVVLDETEHIISKFINNDNNDAPFIYEKVGNRFERFMIDEFQDTSESDWSNFVPLLREAMSENDDESVFIVGDVKQSIYRFQGGDWRILARDVQNKLGKDNVVVEPLEDNWRSKPCIVNFNNDLIGRIVKAHNEKLNSKLLSAVESGYITNECKAELHDTLKNAYTAHSQNARKTEGREGYIRVEGYDKVSPFIEAIESAIGRGYKYSDITILYRNSKDAPIIIKQLLDYKQDKQLDFNIRTQESLVIGLSPVCQFVIAVLRLSQNRNEKIYQAVINDYLSRYHYLPLRESEDALLDNICQLPPNEAFEHIVKHFSLNDDPTNVAYLQAMQEQIITFCKKKFFDIALFLQYWDEKGKDESLSVSKSENAIELLTIHKAKGLQNKVIIIPYCKWSLFNNTDNTIWADTTGIEGFEGIGRYPISGSEEIIMATPFAKDFLNEQIYSHVDAINLLYVAVTRAEDELYIYIPQKSNDKNIGSLVAAAVNDTTASDYNIEARRSEGVVEYGSHADKDEEKEQEEQKVKSIIMQEYPTNPTHGNLRLSTQRYYQDKAVGMSSQREVGIMMHSILCEATDFADIERRIEEAHTQGRINAKQRDELREVISREFARDCVKEWFSDGWEAIRNEQDIICGSTIGTRRPDRVMTKGCRAVIVDYKFGNEPSGEYVKKMRLYMDLLRQMGYDEVEGYLWYMTIGKIEKVE